MAPKPNPNDPENAFTAKLAGQVLDPQTPATTTADVATVWTPASHDAGGPVSADHASATATHGVMPKKDMYGYAGGLFANDRTGFQNLSDLLNAAGYKNSGTRSSVDRVWRTALGDASALGSPEDPFSYLQRIAGEGKGFLPGGKKPGSAGAGRTPAYKGPVARTNFTNEFDAEAIANQALSHYLGRDARPDELAAFKAKLSGAEKANPTVATPVGHDVVQSGGVNPQQVAKDFALGQSDYAETQASTTLMDWMRQAVVKGASERVI